MASFCADATEDRRELVLADQEREVLRVEPLIGTDEVERHAVVDLDDMEWAPRYGRRQAEQIGQER